MTTVVTVQHSHTYSPDAFIPIGEAAKVLAVSVGTLRRWEKDGRISSFRTPTGHRRFRRDEVEALLKASA